MIKTAMEEMFEHLKAMNFLDIPFRRKFLQKEKDEIKKAYDAGYKDAIAKNKNYVYSETMVYPFTEDAISKLTQLMFFGRIEKVAIAAPNNDAPYLIIDHIEFINHPDYGLVPGYKGEQKKRTAINFNYSKT